MEFDGISVRNRFDGPLYSSVESRSIARVKESIERCV